MSEQKNTDCLKLLNDSVLDLKTDSDEFHHEAYANILAKILNPDSGNKYGISVALFGKWGQGKSSIVEMLRTKLSTFNTETIVFNAWSTRGDSVRRQMILKVLEIVNPNKAKEFKKHTGTSIPSAFEEITWWGTFKTYLKTLLSIMTSPMVGVSLSISVTLIVIVIFSFALAFGSDKYRDVYLAIATLIASISAFLILKTCDAIKTIYEKCTDKTIIAEHHLLKYPEQFAEIASRYISIFCKAKMKDILIVVDDLDRCDPTTVVEALAAIKQLSAIHQYEKAKYPIRVRFLVPCDEHQVVLALEADGHDAGSKGGNYHDYKSEELLRKFFDVVVRMDTFIPEDMVTYAGKILQNAGRFNQNDISLIQELIGAVAPRDPRQVKQLVNAYLVFREKISAMQSAKLFRAENTLSCFDKTLLFTIALQETIPEVFKYLVETSDSIKELQEPSSTVSSKSEHFQKAARILRSLEPVSEQTFRLLTRKGLPEALNDVSNGSDIYDAILTGNEHLFEIEIAKTNNLNQVAIWLKQHRLSMQSTAQFRHALNCLIGTDKIEDEILSVIQDYLQFPKLKEALKDYAGMERLATLGVDKKLTNNGYIALWKCISTNLDELDTAFFIGSNELKSMLILSTSIPESYKHPFINKLARLLRIKEPQIARDTLIELADNLPENYKGFSPTLALTIATECTWAIYDTLAPDETERLHSNLIATFAGDDENTTVKIVDGLFQKTGPLGTIVNFKAGNSPKGEREALRTLEKIAKNLTGLHIQKLFGKLFPWLKLQPDITDYKSICDIMSHIWTSITEKQIDEFVQNITDRALSSNATDWFLSFVDSGKRDTDSENKLYAYFCKKVLNRLNEIRLNNNNLDETTKKLLNGMAEQKWPIQAEADSIFEEAIKSKVGDKSSWELWRNAFWPIIAHNHPKTEQAVREKIKQKQLLDQLIPFAVETICNKKVSWTFATTLKEYFLAEPNTLNKYFVSMFKDQTIVGTEQIIKLIVDDLPTKTGELGQTQVDLLINNCSCMTGDTKANFEKYLKVQYLHKDDINRISKGIHCLEKLVPLETETLELIRKIDIEQGKSLSDETKTSIRRIQGEIVAN